MRNYARNSYPARDRHAIGTRYHNNVPTYKSDLAWLKATHPTEYARIPDQLLNDALYFQRHGEEQTETGGGLWMIMFVAKDEREDAEVVLGIPRPDAEDSTMEWCADHTLRVSREYCPQHCTVPLDSNQNDGDATM